MKKKIAVAVFLLSCGIMAETYLHGPIVGKDKEFSANWKISDPEAVQTVENETGGLMRISPRGKAVSLLSKKFPLKPASWYYAVIRMRSASGKQTIRAGFVGNSWKWVILRSIELSDDWQWFLVKGKSPAVLAPNATVWAQFSVPAGKKVEVSNYGLFAFDTIPGQLPDTMQGAPGSYPEAWFPADKPSDGKNGLSNDFQTGDKKLTMYLCAKRNLESMNSARITMPKSGKVRFSVKMRSTEENATVSLFLIGDNYKWIPRRKVTVTNFWQTFTLSAQFPEHSKAKEFWGRVDVQKGGEIVIADLKIELLPQ